MWTGGTRRESFRWLLGVLGLVVMAGCSMLDHELGGPASNEAVITTSFADALGPADVPEDFGRGAHFEPLASLPRDETGAWVLRPGFFTFEAQSFCLHAGTRGPSQGGGYLWAPLQGPGAPIIQALLRSAGSKPQVAQHDVQMLVWALESGTPPRELNPELQRVAAELLTPEELRRVNGSLLERLAPGALAATRAHLPPEVQRVLELRDRIRQSFVSGRATYEQVRQLAVLPALASSGGGVPKGRWSQHPGGFLVRYLPANFTHTRVDVYVPRAETQARSTRGASPIVLASFETPAGGAAAVSLPQRVLDLARDVAVPADTGEQRLGFSGSGYAGGGGASGGGGSSDSYGEAPGTTAPGDPGHVVGTPDSGRPGPGTRGTGSPGQGPTTPGGSGAGGSGTQAPGSPGTGGVGPSGKKPIPCGQLPASYEFTSLGEAVREVEERLGLPPGSGYPAESKEANTGPCAKGSGYLVGQHIAVRMESNDEYIGSIGQCTCEPPRHDRFRVINP